MVEIKETCLSKNLDETVCLKSQNVRKEKSQYERYERDYKGLQRKQVTLLVWPAHQPCCSPGETSVRGPIVALWNRRREKTVSARSAREIEVKGNTYKTTKWGGQSESQREVADLLVLPKPAKSLQNGAGLNRKT